MQVKRILLLSVVAAMLASCSTSKNTVVTRAFHNLTARYNGYYYSCENIDEGVYKIEKGHKDNFDKVLPVYIYPTPEAAKATFPEFDKAIKKSSTCIQRHAIKDKKGNEIPSSGKWIDNNWINVGISHFYKRDFFSGIDVFEYVVRTYTKSDDKYTAMVWLVKAYNEIGSVSNSDPTISFLKNHKKLPRKIRNELPVISADYYIRQGLNTEAVARLMEATRNKNFFTGLSKKRRARYAFIIAQLSEQSGNNNRARDYYTKTIKLKPAYEMVFYSKIKLARLLDVKRGNSEKTKKDLLKMAKEFKNSDYFDVIYYTLGEIEEKESHVDAAFNYYQKSVKTSVSNPSQKALSYLKLGEISFDKTSYQPAEAYYDSALASLPQDHPRYNSILARKETLGRLVTDIRTISREDSLQRIAGMSKADREAFVDKMIAKLQEEEERKKREIENAMSMNTNTNTVQNQMNDLGSQSTFYFYNPTTVSFGVAEFTKKWGNRKLEDNWRRANKAVIMEDPNEQPGQDSIARRDTVKKTKYARETYLKDLPVTDTLLARSNRKIMKAYYSMGNIYKEELDNIPRAVAAFEELNRRFPGHSQLLQTYYILYRSYQAQKNTAKEEFYKNKILNEFPDSEFALLIRNPEAADKLNAEKSEVEKFYAETYEKYDARDFARSYELASEGKAKYGTNDFAPRFEFIRIMSNAHLRGNDSLEHQLKILTAKYPNAEVTALANDILLAIKRQRVPPMEQKTVQGDTFTVNMEAEHFILAILADQEKISNAFVNNLTAFNTTYYSNRKFEITRNLFSGSQMMVLIKRFANAKEVMSYLENLHGDPNVFKGDAKKEEIELFPINADNLQLLYKKKNLASYRAFSQDNYKAASKN